MAHAITAEIVRLMREASGLGMADCKRAAQIAVDRLDGDFLLGLLVVDSDQLAIDIRSKDPSVGPRMARNLWNLERARARRADYADLSDAWRALDAASRG